MIRSSTLSLSHMNSGKRHALGSFLVEFRRVFDLVVDELWTRDRVPVLISHKDFAHIDTFLSCRAMQVVTKQASAEVRGTKSSAQTRGKVPRKPSGSDVNPELDYRFVRTNWDTGTTFDAVLELSSLTKDRKKIVVPLNRTRHFNKMMSKGMLTKGCRISKKGVTFVFEIPVVQKTEGDVLGIDVGISDVWSDSRGNRSTDVRDLHGYTLSSIMKRLSRRKKGSKGFRRTQSHRDNFIGWSLNQLDLTGIREIRREDIKHMRRGKRCDRFRSHWIYPEIFRKLEQKAETHGVRVVKVDPRDTSRTCSSCGVVDVKSRRGKRFVCVACGHTQDADLNAALNIRSIGPRVRCRGVCSPSDKKTL